MRLILESEQRIRLTTDDEGFAIEAAGGDLSPFHFLAASLASCTHSVLVTWAAHADLDIAGLEITVEWEFGGDPFQVSVMAMALVWPALPPERREAARRAAVQCTVHATLEHGTRVETTVASP